jgi:hypothetical protein
LLQQTRSELPKKPDSVLQQVLNSIDLASDDDSDKVESDAVSLNVVSSSVF